MYRKLFSTFVVFFLALSLNAAFGDDMQKQQTEDPAMKAWMAYATPGPEHQAMQKLVGTWNTVVKSYMGPSATETKGTSTYESAMDGRYLVEHAEGNFMGMPFHGMGVYGYDNSMKKYVSTWVDNMGTGIMNSWGTSDDAGKTINWSGKAIDPMSGKEQNYRSIMHQISDDEYHFEMYGPGPDGKEAKMMEITYMRQK